MSLFSLFILKSECAHVHQRAKEIKSMMRNRYPSLLYVHMQLIAGEK